MLFNFTEYNLNLPLRTCSSQPLISALIKLHFTCAHWYQPSKGFYWIWWVKSVMSRATTRKAERGDSGPCEKMDWYKGDEAEQESKMCARGKKNETAQKVTGGGSHQNANVVWDIYCRVLMQFKTGSLSCSPSPSPCWALINQPLKADVTWIALHTAAIRLYRRCGNQKTAEKFMKMPLIDGRHRRDQNIEFVCDATFGIEK